MLPVREPLWWLPGLLLSRFQQFCLPLQLVLENSVCFQIRVHGLMFVITQAVDSLSLPRTEGGWRESPMAASGSNRTEAGDLCVAGHQQGNPVTPWREAECRCGDRDGVLLFFPASTWWENVQSSFYLIQNCKNMAF